MKAQIIHPNTSYLQVLVHCNLLFSEQSWVTKVQHKILWINKKDIMHQWTLNSRKKTLTKAFLFHLSVVTPSQYCHNDSICFALAEADLTDFTLNTNIQTPVGPFTAHREGWCSDLHKEAGSESFRRNKGFWMDIFKYYCRFF